MHRGSPWLAAELYENTSTPACAALSAGGLGKRCKVFPRASTCSSKIPAARPLELGQAQTSQTSILSGDERGNRNRGNEGCGENYKGAALLFLPVNRSSFIFASYTWSSQPSPTPAASALPRLRIGIALSLHRPSRHSRPSFSPWRGGSHEPSNPSRLPSSLCRRLPGQPARVCTGLNM